MTLVLLQSVVDIMAEITFALSVKIRNFFAAQNVIHASKNILIRKYAHSSHRKI